METETETQETTHEFNKELQQVQQDKANYQKRSQALEAQADQHRAEIESLKQSLAEVPTPDGGELDAYEQVAQTKKDMESLERRFAESEAKNAQSQASLKKMNQQSDYKDKLKTFDDAYGAQHRNTAVSNVTQLCKDNGYTLEGNDHPAYETIVVELEKAYMRADFESKLKPTVEKPQGDTGIGGSTYNNLDDGIQAGSPEEVLAAMRKMR